ncbi:MAG: VTT domain-containing protein [Firmicutes bacterium]|nr:VTT domain-containing protein [Bacillota bacterium]
MVKNKKYKTVFYIITAAVIVIVCVAAIIGLKKGVFSSKDAFTRFIDSAGVFAPLAFLIVETVTVVVLILPCAAGYPVSTAAFGPLWGFILNAASTILGSIIIFAIVRKWGKPIVESIVKKKHIDKYEKFLGKTKVFEKILVVSFLLPAFPDNALSYLAGLTKMTFKRFVLLTLIFKPWKLLLYTYGLEYFMGKFSYLWSAVNDFLPHIAA